MMSQTIGHGFRYLLWSKVDSTGAMIGTGALPSAGQAQLIRFGRLYGARQLPLRGGEAQVFTPKGDDGALTSFRYGSENLAGGTIGLSVQDKDFEATVQGTKKATKATDYHFGLANPRQPHAQDVALIAIRQAVGYPTQTAKWTFDTLPLAQVLPLGSEYGYRDDAEYQYSYNAKIADRAPWGEAIDESVYGDTGGTVISGDGPHPIQVFMGVGDNTRTTFEFVVDVKQILGVWVDGVIISSGDYTLDVAVSGDHKIVFDTAPANNARVHILAGVPEVSLE
jgi:hypothetical protein